VKSWKSDCRTALVPYQPGDNAAMQDTRDLPCLTWDIFCHVIDNWGDLGVCWRLAAQLAERGQQVRLWADDNAPLNWMAPGAREGHWPNVELHDWPRADANAAAPTVPPGDVLVEAFGCEIQPQWVQALQPSGDGRVWLNLEYLSAEAYVQRCHGLPSPVLSGPLLGRMKWFFYPGFANGTGGLLRETALLERQNNFDRDVCCAANASVQTPTPSFPCSATNLQPCPLCCACPSLQKRTGWWRLAVPKRPLQAQTPQAPVARC